MILVFPKEDTTYSTYQTLYSFSTSFARWPRSFSQKDNHVMHKTISAELILSLTKHFFLTGTVAEAFLLVAASFISHCNKSKRKNRYSNW